MHLSSDGRLFQALGPATAKDRWPSPEATMKYEINHLDIRNRQKTDCLCVGVFVTSFAHGLSWSSDAAAA